MLEILLLPNQKDILRHPIDKQHPLVANNKMRLVAWKILGERFIFKGFCRQLSHKVEGKPPHPHVVFINISKFKIRLEYAFGKIYSRIMMYLQYT